MKLEELQSTNDYSQSSLSSSSNLRLRISVSSHQGGRKYMEDEYIIIHYQPKNLNQETLNNNDDNLFQKSFVFFGIFDGHGGDMAARYTRQNLCHNIVRQRKFWSEDDDQICLAIHKGFVRTQKEMLREVGKFFSFDFSWIKLMKFLFSSKRKMATNNNWSSINIRYNSINIIHYEWKILYWSCW